MKSGFHPRHLINSNCGFQTIMPPDSFAGRPRLIEVSICRSFGVFKYSGYPTFYINFTPSGFLNILDFPCSIIMSPLRGFANFGFPMFYNNVTPSGLIQTAQRKQQRANLNCRMFITAECPKPLSTTSHKFEVGTRQHIHNLS